MGNRKFRWMAEHVLLRYPFLHLRGRIPPSKKQQTSEIYKACFDISQRVQFFFVVTQRNKKPQLGICHRPVGLLTCRLYGRHTCELYGRLVCKPYNLIAHKLGKYHICYGNPTIYKHELRLKACVLQNTARYVFSRSK